MFLVDNMHLLPTFWKMCLDPWVWCYEKWCAVLLRDYHDHRPRIMGFSCTRRRLMFIPLLTRRRSCSFADYWKHFMARFNDVRAFGYNRAGSERIWMKIGAVRVYCLELALVDFGRDSRRSESGRVSGIFCLVNNARLYRFPVGQIS